MGQKYVVKCRFSFLWQAHTLNFVMSPTLKKNGHFIDLHFQTLLISEEQGMMLTLGSNKVHKIASLFMF